MVLKCVACSLHIMCELQTMLLVLGLLTRCKAHNMILYLFTAIGFPLGGCDLYTCTKVGKGQLFIQKEKQHTKHRIHKNRK